MTDHKSLVELKSGRLTSQILYLDKTFYQIKTLVECVCFIKVCLIFLRGFCLRGTQSNKNDSDDPPGKLLVSHMP